ncbi:MAG TPA: SDR family oxidoreductase [Blastocatellia bacterium]|nr:SDR family oxidoreductase [Blastocatellia bacterium]
MDLGLKDKVAVITGGSAGIGLAVARALAREKAHVVLCARDEARTVEQAREISREYGVTALGLRCDVTRLDDISSVVAAVEQSFGGADILINNAGAGSRETIMDAADERWRHYWDLHVMAAVRFSRGLAPAMRRRGGGVIINNASICARQPLDYEPIYNVTKAALMMLSKCLADELIRDNIRVNCINPGLILTAAWEEAARQAVAGTGADWREYLDRIAREKAPIGRFASPEELADFFVFLCSPRASYCVGSTLQVDGGWLKVVA